VGTRQSRVKREDGKVWIEDVQPTGDGNGHVRGLQVLLAHAGTPVSYERLMGLSGMAFITQADAGHRWKGTLDVGWWPLDEWGVSMRLDFLGRAVGYDLKHVSAPVTSPPDAAAAYRAHLEPLVRKSIDEGRPLLTPADFGFVIFGYDDDPEQPPVLGRCSRATTAEMGHIEGWPWALFILGEPTTPMDADAADLAALQYAVELAYDRAGPDEPRWRGRRFTGRKAFAAWAAVLRDPQEPVEDRHHANMKGNLHWNRSAAVGFLQEMAGRHQGEAADALQKAVASYESAVKQLEGMSCNGLAGDLGNRRALADRVDRLATTELEAAKHLQAVVVALGGTLTEAGSGTAELQDGSGGSQVIPKRSVLEGVPKVAYHTDRWRFTPFCNALDACLQYLGEDEQYDYLMCTSGAMFRMTWTPKAWDGGNSDILGMALDPLEPMRRAFWSAGYQMVPVAKAEPDGWAEDILGDSAQRLRGQLTDEAGFRRRITRSIQEGRPVIAFGVIGPPEACVITGYDEGGDVLIGWNVFQNDEGAETEPSGYFRVRDWYPKTHALLLLGERVGKPHPREVDRETLKWALEVLRTSRVRNTHAGPAAFEAWAADMLNDEYFPEGNIGVLRARLMCHWDSMTVTATRGSGSATAFLRAAGEREPAMAEHLRAAADCLDREDVVHGVAPGEEAQMARLADPAVRRRVAGSIVRARDMHVETADHIEKALLAAGVSPEDIPRPEAVRDEPAGERPGRVVLEGVPKVGFGVIDGHVGMTPFPACLRACLEYMGDDLGFGSGGKYPRGAVYAYLMGTTGAAFRLLWKPGWHGDNVATFAIYDDPSEIFRRGFAAVGYEQIPSGHVPDAEKRERFRSMVIESVRDRSLPVIAHGVIGPPEEAIIAGYDEEGRVAIGWSFFQDREIGHAGVEFEPNGYFRKRGWEADTWSMMAIGDKVGMPERSGAYIGALQNALRIMRTPVRGDCHNGIAAYDAWAEHILRDDEVAAGGGPDDPFMVHCDAADVVAEGRHYASVFLKQAAEVLPEAKDDLLAAAGCYKAEHDLIWKLWGVVGSNVPSEETRREFLKPDVRRRIEPIIRQARDRDTEAAGHIERALLALGAEVPEPPEPLAQPVAGDADPTMLDGLTFPKWSITELGCMKAGVDYLGRDVPKAWLYGGTAHAFFINIHEDVDLEAVTAWDRKFVRELTPNLGFLIDGFIAKKQSMEEGDFRSRQHEAWRFVRRSILLKQPCYGWELKAPYGDYWLITGFDDVGYYYDGWETGGPTPWQKLGDQFIPVLQVYNVKLCEPAADEVVVREALAAALEHSRPNWDPTAAADAHFGPEAFDAWAHALESGAALHNHHAYNALAWHECREMAVEFLREAKRRLPGRCDAAFDEALAHYAVVRDKLAALKELTPIDPKLGWNEEPKLQNTKAAALVREAGVAERKGLAALADILVAPRWSARPASPSAKAWRPSRTSSSPSAASGSRWLPKEPSRLSPAMGAAWQPRIC